MKPIKCISRRIYNAFRWYPHDTNNYAIIESVGYGNMYWVRKANGLLFTITEGNWILEETGELPITRSHTEFIKYFEEI